MTTDPTEKDLEGLGHFHYRLEGSRNVGTESSYPNQTSAAWRRGEVGAGNRAPLGRTPRFCSILSAFTVVPASPTPTLVPAAIIALAGALSPASHFILPSPPPILPAAPARSSLNRSQVLSLLCSEPPRTPSSPVTVLTGAPLPGAICPPLPVPFTRSVQPHHPGSLHSHPHLKASAWLFPVLGVPPPPPRLG